MRGTAGIGRRDFLRLGAIASILGTGIVRPLPALEGARKRFRRAIWVWGDGGGPAGPDSFDPKPGKNVDQIFPEIQTSVPGLRFTDQFPKLAGLADQMTLFRGRINTDLNHPTAIASTLQRDAQTGEHLPKRIADRDPSTRYVYTQMPNVISAFDYPNVSFSAKDTAYWQPESNAFKPPIVATPDPRIEEKFALKRQLSSLGNHIDGAAPDRMERHMETAYREILRAGEGELSFSEKDIERYCGGMPPNPMLLAPLLARDLVREDMAGSVLLRMGYSSGYGGWDTHGGNEKRIREMAPWFDHSVACLIEDVRDGLLPNTVVIYDTEFGRTPKMSGDGRDHFPTHTSFIVGDAYAHGSVVGQTDNHGRALEGISNGLMTNESFASAVWEGVTDTPDFAARAKLPGDIFKPAAR